MKKLLLLLLLIIPFVSASYISIQSTITTMNDSATVSVTNLGDEPAHNVQLILNSFGITKYSQIKRLLNIREKFKWDFDLGDIPSYPGSYPLILTTTYHDANFHPFSALSVSTFDYKEKTTPKITTKINRLKLSDKGKLELNVKNEYSEDIEAKISLIIPTEFKANTNQQKINLMPNQEKTINFEIQKKTALPGSTYSTFAVVEYDYKQKHYTSSASGVVNVIDHEIISIKNNFLILSFLVLIILFIFLELKNRKKF